MAQKNIHKDIQHTLSYKIPIVKIQTFKKLKHKKIVLMTKKKE